MVLTVAALRTELLYAPKPRVALGVGKKAAPHLVEILKRKRPAGVLVVGFCGGLQAVLPPGTLVLADQLIEGSGARHAQAQEVPMDGELLGKAREALPEVRMGRLVTVDWPAGPAEKARLSLNALAVDMESFGLAGELSRRGTPFLVARVVLDALWEEPPVGARRALWARRAIACARQLGRAARAFSPVLAAI